MYIPDFWCGVIVGVVATLILAAAATIFKKRKKIKRHFNMWNEWRKDSLNSKLYKFLVLLRIKKSSTFDLYVVGKMFNEGFCEGFNEQAYLH